MKQTVGYVTLGVCAYLIFTVVMFPADLAYVWLSSSLNNVALYDVKGTAWSGRAAAVRVGDRNFRGVAWDVRPWSVVLGRVDANVRFDNGESWAKGNLGLGLDKTLRMSGLDAQLAMSEIKPMLPKLPVDLGGLIAVNLESGHFDTAAKKLTDVTGNITWQNASLPMLNNLALGNFRVDLTTTNEGIHGKFNDDGSGPLVAEGTLLLKPDNSYQLNGTLAARDKARADIANGIRFIPGAKPEPDGRVKVSFAGTL